MPSSRQVTQAAWEAAHADADAERAKLIRLLDYLEIATAPSDRPRKRNWITLAQTNGSIAGSLLSGVIILTREDFSDPIIRMWPPNERLFGLTLKTDWVSLARLNASIARTQRKTLRHLALTEQSGPKLALATSLLKTRYPQ